MRRETKICWETRKFYFYFIIYCSVFIRFAMSPYDSITSSECAHYNTNIDKVLYILKVHTNLYGFIYFFFSGVSIDAIQFINHIFIEHFIDKFWFLNSLLIGCGFYWNFSDVCVWLFTINYLCKTHKSCNIHDILLSLVRYVHTGIIWLWNHRVSILQIKSIIIALKIHCISDLKDMNLNL